MLFGKRVILKSIVIFLCLIAVLVHTSLAYDSYSYADFDISNEDVQRSGFEDCDFAQVVTKTLLSVISSIRQDIKHYNDVRLRIEHCKYIWFCQFDSRWANVPYGCGTIGDSGCGVCATTVILDCLLEREDTPDQISNRMFEFFDGWQPYYLPGAGTIHSGMVAFLQSYDLNVMYYDDIFEAMNFVCDHQGESCIYISSRGPFLTIDGIEYWTGGHVIAAYLVDDDCVYVQDSGRWDTCNVRYTRDQFASLSSSATAILVVSK